MTMKHKTFERLGSDVRCPACGSDKIEYVTINDGCRCKNCDCAWIEHRRKLLQAPSWIPTTERLPEPKSRVLAYTPHNAHSDVGPISVQNGSSCKHDITHWMPLPQPPERGGE